MDHVSPCWFILCQSLFNNYGLQLYTLQKWIMSALVGLFYTEVSLTIIVSNYMKYENGSCKPMLGLFYVEIN